MASNIGIKIANGEFYPLIEENSSIKKKLILTTVHDNQPSVQIDLFRSAENTMTDAQYIGSVVVEKIRPKPKGEPSIEMVISSNGDGEIIADAIDLDKGSDSEHYVLTVSLKSLDETSRDLEIPDFELESGEEQNSGLYQHAEKIRRQKPHKSRTWLFILIGLIIILGLLAVWLFLFGGMNIVSSMINRQSTVQTEQPPLPVNETNITVQPPVVETPTTPAVEAAPVITAPVVRTESTPEVTQQVPVIQAPSVPPAPRPQASASRPSAPVASYNVPATIPREGVNYRIRYGDTLWDISEAFYRDPWQYQRIAHFNNISNPNHIISGRIIRIPPRAQ